MFREDKQEFVMKMDGFINATDDGGPRTEIVGSKPATYSLVLEAIMEFFDE